MGISDVKALTINDENASDDDRLVTAARPNTSATMANTTFAGGAARNVIVTTTGTGDNAKTCTITGTDVFGDAMTEVITSTGSAEAVAGLGYELTVIAAVVVGGTSLFGGTGNILGTIIGAMLFGVLQNGLVLLNVSSYVQQIIIGTILILAVAFDRFSKSTRSV